MEQLCLFCPMHRSRYRYIFTYSPFAFVIYLSMKIFGTLVEDNKPLPSSVMLAIVLPSLP